MKRHLQIIYTENAFANDLLKNSLYRFIICTPILIHVKKWHKVSTLILQIQ